MPPITRRASFVANLALSLALAPLAAADDWLAYRGPAHNGISAEADWSHNWPDGGPKVAWKGAAGVGASSFAVAGNRAVTAGNRGNRDVVTCFNLDDGSVLWSYQYAQPLDQRSFEGGPASTPTIDGDAVYTLSHEGDLHALRLSTGELLWSRNLLRDFGGRLSGWKYAGSPFIAGNLLIIDTGSRDKSTVALDKTTGREVWAAGSDGAGYATPVPFTHNGTPAVVMTKARHIVGLDLATGRELWRIDWETANDVNAATPTVLGDRLYLSTGYQGRSGRAAAYQLTNSTPRPLWENQEVETKMSSAVVIGGHLYAVSEHQRGKLMCVDAATGRTVWQQSGFAPNGTLIAAAGKLIILDERGDLVIAEANPARYNELARARDLLDGTCWVQPTLASGRLLLRDNDGAIVCLDMRNPSN